MSLTDQVTVITGASGQLGPVVARAFADAGARLALVAPSQAELDALAANLAFPASRVFTSARDLMDDASAFALADAVIAHYGRVDILLHLAGEYAGGGLVGMETETWDYMLNVNLRAAMNVMRAFIPYLTAHGWGRIVTLSSILAQRPSSAATAYAVAKAGLEALTLAAAHEVKDKGATANVIVIKALETAPPSASQAKASGATRPEEIAALLLFLCSDEAGAINGARIPVVR